MPKRRIAILGSGGGTTAEAFIRRCASGDVSAEVILVISNQPSPGIFDKAEKLNKQFSLDIKCLHIGKGNYPEAEAENTPYGHQTKAEERAILDALEHENIDFVALLGYMKLVGSSIVKIYGWQPNFSTIYQARMINTHPGILPETKGLYGIHVQKYAIINNTRAGHCIFAVDDAYDDGPIISEHFVEKLPDDTPESLFERVKESERKNLPTDIQKFIKDQEEYNG